MLGASGPARIYRLPLPETAGASELVLGERTLLMGIVNVTPDSFSDGGRHATADTATAHALALIRSGADLLDIGGESTRPGAPEIPADEQLRRVLPVIRTLRERAPGTLLSIDTRSAEVARAAVAAGAGIVNDVSGLAHDPEMRTAVAETDAVAVVMHMRGTPQNMRERVHYDDVVGGVIEELSATIQLARDAGVRHVIADPGLGFAKTAEQSLALLAAAPQLRRAFAELDAALLIGASRKSFLAPVSDESDPPEPRRDRLPATVAAVAVCALAGTEILRVHDVAECRPGIRLADALRAAH